MLEGRGVNKWLRSVRCAFYGLAYSLLIGVILLVSWQLWGWFICLHAGDCP